MPIEFGPPPSPYSGLPLGDTPPVTGNASPAPPPMSVTQPPASSPPGTEGLEALPQPSPDALPGAGSTPLDGLEEQFSADVYAFLALFQALAQTMKTTAKLEATSELQAQVNALVSAAEDMKKSAHKRFASAMTQAIGQIVAGAVQVVAGSLALMATMKSASKENESIKTKESADALRAGAKDGAEGDFSRAFARDLDRYSKALEQISKKLAAGGQFGNVAGTGLAQTITGSASLDAARSSRDAELTDAERTQKEAVAAEHEKAYQAALEFASTMQQIITDTQQTLKAMEDKRNEAFSASLRA